ncbi:MAG: hypothetical protein K0T99_02645 [Alphaproteobacteria bacterium]|nr:hypothetical protein [Alphaproteobacteria bacterium]
MKQDYLFKLFIFVIALLGYLYLFDPSFIRFVNSGTQVINLNFDDRHLINTCIWLLGFWGILVYLNVDKPVVRNLCWAIFIFGTFINFLYIETVGNFISLGNAAKIWSVLSDIGKMEFSELLKFIIASGSLVGLSIIIKPLSIGIGRWTPIVIGIMVAGVIFIFSGKNIALQSAYLVPGVIIYKYILSGLAYLKQHFASGTPVQKKVN